ncbi:hypothetical protein N7478_003798 [Penicillium angulare]|uniref:uncharacterized protein n=1 Tax=Penicillium angulare TaxID=116970 RepID=UPI00253FFD92|nr:uncharacterized protein N7478_003798 [Penicillium angulare]KAJ5288112.1 hypothetical protein N7478_003798 [Penicillium angulare]
MTGKLPIARLPRERRESGRGRTSHACDACRARKAKCDGDQPRCAQCVAQGDDECVYSDRKAVRLQKELQAERGKTKAYKEMLQDLSLDFEGPIADRIRRFLKQDSRAAAANRERRGSISSSSSSIGSLEDVDVASEDFNRHEKSRATGYLGKNSEVVWMQRLGVEATKQSDDGFLEPSSTVQGMPDNSLSSTNYHLDEETLQDPTVLNAFVLPPKARSDKLFHIYLDKVQIALPILRQDLFCAQYDRCFLGGFNPGAKWLAIFNLVLAIGSVFSRLSGENVPDIDEDILFARAKSLSASENILYQHDDLQQVQIESLIAFFFLAISQINRSWKMIGIAARSGISLGINLHEKHDELDADSEEARKQLWWSIFRLEHLLSLMTGRVSCIGSASSSLPPPLPLPSLAHTGLAGQQADDVLHSQLRQLHWTMQTNQNSTDMQSKLLKSLDPSASLYHFYMVDLSLISHAISGSVYATDSYRTDWARIESRISLYNRRMNHWATRLHAGFQFEDKYGNLLSTIKSPFQISLAMYYYSCRIVLNRPCLNRPAFEKTSGARLARSRFSNLSALACLQASLTIIALLPDQVSLKWAYDLLQWWDFVHVLTQATVILLLDVAIGPVPTKTGEAHVISESVQDVLKAAKKSIRWLQVLGNTSGSAQRSFEFANRCIHSLTAGKESGLSDIPSVAHHPHASRSTREKKRVEFENSPSEGLAPPEKSNSGSIAQEQPSIFSLYDCDTDMPDVPPQFQDSKLEDLLLSMMSS